MALLALLAIFAVTFAAPFDWFPKYDGAIAYGQPAIHYQGLCFQSISGELTELSTSKAVVTFEVANPKSLTCIEHSLLFSAHDIHYHALVTKGTHKVQVTIKDNDQYVDIKQNGLRSFHFSESILSSVIDAWRLYDTFVSMKTMNEKQLLKFFHDEMNYTFIDRTDVELDIPEELVHSGDVLTVHILAGEETMGWYLVGEHTGHAVVCLRHPNGTLYVVETTDAEFFPGDNGFHMTPWKDWIKLYHGQHYEAVWLKLQDKYASRFNEKAAWDFFNSHFIGDQHLQFLVPSYYLTALDRTDHLLPPKVQLQSALMLAFLADYIDRAEVYNDITAAVSMRLRHYYNIPEWDCKTVECLISVADRYNLSLPELVALPEQDGWLYNGWPSIVCAGLVTHVLRAGGVFDGLTINAGEFTPKDVVELNIYETDMSKYPADCAKYSPVALPYCQLYGSRVIELPHFNTVPLYSHMNEHCGSQPPDYVRYPADSC